METGKMKNMVVLKNLQSNIVEEAIVVLKNNKRIKSFDYVKNKKNNVNENTNKSNSKDYIVNEAQMLISNYISEIEKKETFKSQNVKSIEKKYKKLKLLTIILASIVMVNLLMNVI